MLKRIKKGDTVICLSGKDAGKKGKVLKVITSSDRVVVEKMNIAKKHQRATKQFQGGIIEKPASIPASRLMLVCPRCNEPSRIRAKTVSDGKKVRLCIKCEEPIDKV